MSLDLAIIFVYLAGMIIVGYLTGKKESLDDFLISGRKVKTRLLTFTLISTQVGAGTMVGLLASGYDYGISPGIFALTFVVGFFLTAIFAPYIKRFGDKFKSHTLPDFLAIRYTNQSRVVGGIAILVIFFFFMAAQFVGMGALIKVLTGWNFTLSIILASIVVIVYTTLGGLKSVFHTDFIQFWILFIVLFFVLLPIVIIEGGGFSALATLPSKYFSVFSFGGPVFLIAALILIAPTILVSMDMWQRVYAAADVKTARRSFILAGVFYLPFLFLIPVLGMFAKILFPAINPNTATFELMTNLLPTGILGLGLAAFFAALMSTADSMLMVSSAVLAKDFYRSFIGKQASEKKVLKLARIFSLIVGFVGLGVALLIPSVIELIISGFTSLTIFLPAVLGGFFWKRATTKAATFSILFSFLTIIALLIPLGQMAFVPGFMVSLVLFIVLSFLTSHAPTETTEILQEIRSWNQ